MPWLNKWRDSRRQAPNLFAASVTGAFGRHVETPEAGIEAAMRDRRISPDWTAMSLACRLRAAPHLRVLPSAFIRAKAKGWRLSVTASSISPGV
jgi:hypothetical protein